MRLRRSDKAVGRDFDEDHLESRLVWIWSSSRSGSTWFLRLLSHPIKIVQSPPGPDDYLGLHVPPGWPAPLRVLPVPTTFVGFHLDPVVGEPEYGEDFRPRTLRSALEGKVSYLFSRQYADVWMPEMRRLILARFNRMIERAGEKYALDDPLILIKEAGGGWSAPLIMSLFPRSRMIFLVRDGRDVVDSQLAAASPGGWLHESEIGQAMSTAVDEGHPDAHEREQYIRSQARSWVGGAKATGRAYEAHDPGLRRMARYEDVLAEPAAQLRSLNDWLQLKRNDRWVDRAVAANSFDSLSDRARGPNRFFRSAKPGAWRENLSEEEQGCVNAIMRETLVELGYERAEVALGSSAG